MNSNTLSRRALTLAAAASLAFSALPACADSTLLNVSYDPTRELYFYCVINSLPFVLAQSGGSCRESQGELEANSGWAW